MLLGAIQEKPVDLEYVKGLIKTASDEDKSKSMAYAIQLDNPTLLRHLAQNGIDIRSRDFAGFTALHLAVTSGKINATKKLIELGADPEVRDYQFDRPIDIALRDKNLNMIRILLNKPNLTPSEAKLIPGFGKLQSEVDYSQARINANLSKFLDYEGRKEGKAREHFLNDGGNCNGWSFLLQYYIGIGSEEEFWEILECISNWDPLRQPEPYDVRLSDLKGVSPKLAEKYRTLGKLMRYTLNDLAWFQQPKNLSIDTNIKQNERIRQWQIIKGAKEKVELKEIFSLKSPRSELGEIQETLELARRWPNSWIDIGIFPKDDVHRTKGHAISIYITPAGEFVLYDSNRKKRFPATQNSAHIANFIMVALRKDTIIADFDLYRFYPTTEPVPEKSPPTIPVPSNHYNNEMGKRLLLSAVNSALMGTDAELDLVKSILKDGGSDLLVESNNNLITQLSKLALLKEDKELRQILSTKGIELSNNIYNATAKIALEQGEINAFVRICSNARKNSINVNVDNRNLDDYAAIHIAINNNDKRHVKDLLQLGIDKEATFDHETPVYQAARLGHTAIVKTLARNGCDLNVQKGGYTADAGYSPLHAALRNGHVEVAEVLLANGVEVGLKDKSGKTAFELEPLKNKEGIEDLITRFKEGKLDIGKRKKPVLVKVIKEEEDKPSATLTVKQKHQ